MKIEELKDKWSKNYAIGSSPVLIAHEKNKTVNFWPTSLDEDATHYKVHGYWIMLQNGEPIVREQIKIKKEDLKDWHIVEDE